MENNTTDENTLQKEIDLQKLTPQQKKTILGWAKYIGKAVLVAILKKLTMS